MKKDYTHISIILDRTGSMETIRQDTIGGFNTFLEEQKSQPGKATMTIVQFDSQDSYEVVHHFKPIKDISRLTEETYVPRASTPLLDAIGRGINDLEKSIGELKAKERPSKVIFVVLTDGQENASKEFRKDQIEKMVKDKTVNDKWQFTFLGADLAGINDAMSTGFGQLATLAFTPDSKGIKCAYASLSSSMTSYRSGAVDTFVYNDSDRKRADDPMKNKP